MTNLSPQHISGSKKNGNSIFSGAQNIVEKRNTTHTLSLGLVYVRYPTRTGAAVGLGESNFSTFSKSFLAFV